MENNAHSLRESEAPVVVHNELAIVLVAPHFDPGHINPDFLRYNGIVDRDWQVERPIIIESGLSLIEYDNGLTVSAGNRSLRIEQSGQPLTADEIVVPDVVRRYLEMAPWPVEHSAVHTDLIGSIDVAGEGMDRQVSPLYRVSLGMPFHDVSPNLQARASYRFPDKSIVMYISESTDNDSGYITTISLSAHVHRDIGPDLSAGEQTELINSAIEQWKADVDDFDHLGFLIYRSYSQQEF